MFTLVILLKKMYGVTNKAFTYEKGKIDQTSYSKITLVNKNGNYLSCSGELRHIINTKNDKTEILFTEVFVSILSKNVY